MNINGVEYIKADKDLLERVKMLESSLRKCRDVIRCRQQEVGDRYGRARGDIEQIIKESIGN